VGGGAKRKQNIKQKNMEKNINEIREEALKALQIEKDKVSTKIDEIDEQQDEKEELEEQLVEIQEEIDDIKERENEEE